MADTFQVQLEFEGQTHTFPCQSDQTVLAAAEAANVGLPSSCCAGVCTTCAASIRSGELHQPDAMGVKEELRQKGFALLCVAHPAVMCSCWPAKKMRSTRRNLVSTENEVAAV